MFTTDCLVTKSWSKRKFGMKKIERPATQIIQTQSFLIGFGQKRT